ncbi:MAG: response regulator [Acidobacteriota bacterium]|nr:response regulator [Acidobacteriota bacterium]
MNLLQLVKRASAIYLKHAYPEKAPEPPMKMVETIQGFQNEDAMLAWSEFEKEDQRYALRLGNHKYPHMKMVFLAEKGNPSFYVDAHDNHFDLPPGVPGYEKLLAIRTTNKKMKKTIESDWNKQEVPIFGVQASPIELRRDCEGLTVLAVDDELQILDMLRLIVSSLGGVLHTAQSAAEARDVLANHGVPDLILCDIMMPEESGYDFVGWLKDKGHNIPVYFITGYALDQVKRDDYAQILQKPFTAKAIMKIMKKVLKERGTGR